MALINLSVFEILPELELLSFNTLLHNSRIFFGVLGVNVLTYWCHIFVFLIVF